MKVLFYCDWFKEYTADLALAVASRSNEVAIIGRANSREFERRRNDETALHGRILDGGVELCLLKGRYSSLKSLISVLGIYRRKRKAGYRCFHLQQTGDPRLLWLALRMPTVLTLHEPSARHGVSSGTDRLHDLTNATVERAYRRLADRIVVHTQGSMEGLTSVERRKAVVIPHGVGPRALTSHRNSQTILFFGRAAAYKGIDTLLAAMDFVWESEPTARLRILASPGDFLPVSGLDRRVDASWDGYTNAELDLELSTARAVCMPYLSASGSGVGAQAYGAGVPIVASDLEGLRELAARDELIVEPGNPKDLARALIAALRGGDDMPVEIDSRRTWPAVAVAHLDVYRQLAADLS